MTGVTMGTKDACNSHKVVMGESSEGKLVGTKCVFISGVYKEVSGIMTLSGDHDLQRRVKPQGAMVDVSHWTIHVAVYTLMCLCGTPTQTPQLPSIKPCLLSTHLANLPYQSFNTHHWHPNIWPQG